MGQETSDAARSDNERPPKLEFIEVGDASVEKDLRDLIEFRKKFSTVAELKHAAFLALEAVRNDLNPEIPLNVLRLVLGVGDPISYGQLKDAILPEDTHSYFDELNAIVVREFSEILADKTIFTFLASRLGQEARDSLIPELKDVSSSIQWVEHGKGLIPAALLKVVDENNRVLLNRLMQIDDVLFLASGLVEVAGSALLSNNPAIEHLKIPRANLRTLRRYVGEIKKNIAKIDEAADRLFPEDLT